MVGLGYHYPTDIYKNKLHCQPGPYQKVIDQWLGDLSRACLQELHSIDHGRDDDGCIISKGLGNLGQHLHSRND